MLCQEWRVLGEGSLGTTLALLDLGDFLLEGRELGCLIEDVHREFSVVAETLPGNETTHHPLELREAIVDLPNADPTSELKNILVELRREAQEDLGLKLLETDILRLKGLSLEALEDVVRIPKKGGSRTPDFFVP